MNSELNIQRFPPSSDKSLRAWSTADNYLLSLLEEEKAPTSTIAILNDRFGYLTLHLATFEPLVITHFKSQEDAILYNLKANHHNPDSFNQSLLLEKVEKEHDFIIMKIPKSMDLFHLFLSKAHAISSPTTKVYCGFMTRHFTKQMLALSSKYFDVVDQSLAWKKSRVLKLSKPKVSLTDASFLKTIRFLNHRGENHEFKQYFGVFSGNHIDFATQFLLENLTVPDHINKALDLASGNGVIAHEMRQQSKDIEIHLMDDSHLAIESSKLNMVSGKNYFHYAYSLDHFADGCFDLVVCNPPFHFEHENTIEIALKLFQGVSRVLNQKGHFLLVANLHLNYKTQLVKIFNSVKTINMNSKFEVIECAN